MNLYAPQTIRYLKEKYGFHFSKGLGQNFLTDPGVPAAMLEGAHVTEEDLVIEIGPGFGVLTAEAAALAGHVVAIEVDERLLPVLEETLADYDNVEILLADVLKTDLSALIREKRENLGLAGVKIIGNLPYYITTPIIMKLLEEGLPADSITVMMQKEVAERICAAEGSRIRGAISVAVQYYCQVVMLCKVPRHVFVPAPKVDSAVLQLAMRQEKPVQLLDEACFFDCIKAGFGQRRKTLLNSLSGAGGLGKDLVRQVLAAAEIDENRRAETLTMEEFARVANELTSRKQG